MSTLLSLRHYGQEPIRHRHPHAQLVFGLSGLLDFEVAGRGSLITRQSLAVVPWAETHTCGSAKGSQCLVLDVPDEQWLNTQLGPHADASRHLLERPAALQLTPAQSQLVNWLAASPLHDPLIARQGAALLLASLTHERQTTHQGGLPLAALDTHIDQHCAHTLQVEDLARLSGLSTARFHVRFLAATGQTPMDYVRQRRLQLARQLLQQSTLAIGEIASRVGYSSQSAFSAALARQFGCTPRQLRSRRE